jgi:hypothetical protein
VGVLTCEFFGYSGRETGRLTPSWVARSRVRVYPIGTGYFPSFPEPGADPANQSPDAAVSLYAAVARKP